MTDPDSQDKELQEKPDLSDEDYGKGESTEVFQDRLNLQLDTGVVKIRKRNAWWKIWSVDDRRPTVALINHDFRIPRDDPPPPRASLLSASVCLMMVPIQMLIDTFSRKSLWRLRRYSRSFHFRGSALSW